jgi:hypothetical protein
MSNVSYGASREMISPTSALKPGRSGPGCEENTFTHVGGAVWGSGTFLPYLTVVLVSSYPLKPHGHSATFQIVHLLEFLCLFNGVALSLLRGYIWWCLVVYSIMYTWLVFFFFFLSVRVCGQLRTVNDVGPTVHCPVIDGMVCGLQLVAAIRFSLFYLGRGVRERWCVAHPCCPLGVGKPAHGSSPASEPYSRCLISHVSYHVNSNLTFF